MNTKLWGGTRNTTRGDNGRSSRVVKGRRGNIERRQEREDEASSTKGKRKKKRKPWIGEKQKDYIYYNGI